MIAFFRRALSSWVVLALLGLILLAFVVTGVGTPMGLGDGGLGGRNVAKVDGVGISETDAATRIQAQLDAIRQQQPGLDMTAFIRQGGADEVIDQMVNARAFEAFGRANGMVTTSRLVDAELATIQSFKGPTGSFDRNIFLQVLQQRKLTESGLREDIARDKMVSALIIPAAGAARMPGKLVTPYASLLLEQRKGQIAIVPATAISAGAPPTAAELSQFYSRNEARYTVPETRVIRYALFDRSRFDSVAPSDAEIAAAYRTNAARYAGKETRSFTQAVVPTEAAARKIATAARGGQAFDLAAKAGGADAVTLAGQDQSGFAGLTSAAAAKLAFSAKEGTILDPQKSPFGWNVIRVDAIVRTPGKSLAEARAEIASSLAGAKGDAAMADFITKLEDAVADNGTFDEVAKANGLSIVVTPALTGGGIAPDQPNYQADPALTPILRDAFQADLDDDAAVVTVTPNRSYAFYDLERIIPSAPRPLAAIRQQVTDDFLKDRASRQARRIADAIVGKVGAGQSLQAAVASAGIALPAPRPVSVKRLEIAQAEGGQVPRTLQLLFSMAPKRAKVLAMEGGAGWYVVQLDQIIPGNAANAPGLIQATQREMARALGEEYVQQFATAVRADRKATKDAGNIARLKRSLTGAIPSQ